MAITNKEEKQLLTEKERENWSKICGNVGYFARLEFDVFN